MNIPWTNQNRVAEPYTLVLSAPQVELKDALVVAVAYPIGTEFAITLNAAATCEAKGGGGTCQADVKAVDSVDEVRAAPGDAYYW